MARRGEEVDVDGVFEGFGGVGKVGGDDEDVSGADDGFLGVGLVAEEETEGALEDVGDLLVRVRVAGDDGALFEDDAGDHGLGAGDELAGEVGVEGFGGDICPAGEGSEGRHEGQYIDDVKGCVWLRGMLM